MLTKERFDAIKAELDTKQNPSPEIILRMHPGWCAILNRELRPPRSQSHRRKIVKQMKGRAP